MEYLIGLVLALGVLGGATVVGFDRERVFYPAVTITIAGYYVLFAAMAASGPVLAAEIIAAGVFVLLAAIGFRTSLWLVAAALAGHGVFDFVHHHFIENPGVPEWWPGFCMTFDVVAGAYLAVLLTRRPALINRGQ
ncbi:MAG TPA: hypothetical protein VLB07_11075 [Woeseiaceae bacterium]|nr:hypothetical protein [Woeseiaceae bacterium]